MAISDGRLPRVLRRRAARPVVRQMSRVVTAVDRRRYRRGRQTIGGRVARGTPVLLLTTTGRRTGRPRTTPLLYHREDATHLLLVAANGGADWNPDWLHNLVADPRVRVDLDSHSFHGLACPLDADERSEVWSTATHAFPGLEEAASDTSRSIPLVRVELGSTGDPGA